MAALLGSLAGNSATASLIVSFIGEDGGLGGMVDGLIGKITGLDKIKAGAQALTGLVTDGLQTLTDWAVEAEPLEGIRVGFQQTAESMGLQSDTLLQSMQDSSKGLITNIELMKNFNLAAQLVGEDFAKTLPEALGYLTEVGQATGFSMDYLLNSYVLGIARLQPKILDNIGVTVDAMEVYEQYAESIGKTTKELTRNEQQMLLMQFTMDTLKKNTEALNFVDKPWTRWTTEWENLRLEIGDKFYPVLQKLAEFFLRFADEHGEAFMNFIEYLSEELVKLITIIEAFVFEDWQLLSELGWEEADIRRLAEFRQELELIWTTIDEFVRSTVGWENVFKAIAIVVGVTLVAAFVAFLAVLIPLLPLIALLSVLLKNNEGDWGRNWEALSRFSEKIMEFVAAPGPALKAMLETEIPPAAQVLQDALKAVGIDTEALGQKIQELISGALTELKSWMDQKLKEASESLKYNWELLKESANQLGEEIRGDLNQAFSDATDWMQTKMNNASKDLKQAWENLKGSATNLATTIKGTLNQAFTNLKGTIDNVRTSIENIIAAIGRAISAAASLASSLLSLDTSSLNSSIIVGQSPSPLETSVRGITSAVRELYGAELPRLNNALRISRGLQGSGSYTNYRNMNQTWNIYTSRYDPYDEGRVAARLAGGI